MLRVGKIFEEQHQLDSARAQYRRLAARYPRSDAAEDARFRIPWTLYLAHNYRSAAPEFQSAGVRAKDPIDRDMCEYWRARALEKAGDAGGARAIFEKLAESTDSNYYPELASRRIAAGKPDLPAASAPDPQSSGTPAVTGVGEYHMARLQTLRALGLKELEPGELKALEEHARRNRRDAALRARGIRERRRVVRRHRCCHSHGKERAAKPRRCRARAISARLLGSLFVCVHPARARSIPGARAVAAGEPVQPERHVELERARPDAVDSVDGAQDGVAAGNEY